MGNLEAGWLDGLVQKCRDDKHSNEGKPTLMNLWWSCAIFDDHWPWREWKGTKVSTKLRCCWRSTLSVLCPEFHSGIQKNIVSHIWLRPFWRRFKLEGVRQVFDPPTRFFTWGFCRENILKTRSHCDLFYFYATRITRKYLSKLICHDLPTCADFHGLP